MLLGVLQQFSWLDALGFAWFVSCWMGYGWVVERSNASQRSLLGLAHTERLHWARMMLGRDNRVADAALVGNLVHSVSFYANTAMYILTGLVALIGALDRVLSATSGLPIAFGSSREVLEYKLILLLVVFIVAYFKFTWSLRQFNLLSILIGSAPPPTATPEEKEISAQKVSRMNASAGDEFNAGIRAYYFGLAVLTWCISPVLFLIVTSVIVAVLARRDFGRRSIALLCGEAKE